MSPIMTTTVVGWFLSPIITLLLPKILAFLGFDASDKLQDLDIHIIPELKKTMQTVDQERMMQRGKRVKTDLDALDKMAAMLRHALEDAKDIFDDAQHKIVLRCCHRVYGAFTACTALCKCCCVWIACVVRTKSARLLQWVRDSSLFLFLLCRSDESVGANVSAAVVSHKPVQVIIDIQASGGEPDPMTTNAEASGNEIVPVTTGVAASDEPDPVTASTSVVASSDETVSVTPGAAASDEPDPVTTNPEASDDKLDPVTTS